MAILLKEDDPRRAILQFHHIPYLSSAAKSGRPRLRIGIINIMPQAEVYESLILRPLGQAFFQVEVVWIRLRSHTYNSSAQDFILGHYVSFAEAIQRQKLDGLILTGAPVEELPFEEVHYWQELASIVEYAAQHIPSTLGICWGGMALAGLLGLEKQAFEKKLFGVYPNRNLRPGDSLLADDDDVFWCPQSRHSGFADAELEAAAQRGLIRLLSHAPETGYTVFESADQKFVMHMGHPEYEPARLIFEYERDHALGRPDVEAPVHLDLQSPRHSWRSHQSNFFGQWLARIYLERNEVICENRG